MKITSPEDSSLDALCRQLSALSPSLDTPGAWPSEQLSLCAAAGVFEWFLTPEWGGQEWSEADILRGYMKLAAACLTTTFVITQRMGAATRIAASDKQHLKERLLPGLVGGRSFATIGISHLTTSRQHVSRPVMVAEEKSDGFVLDGYSPWVTGGTQAEHVVIGATLPDERQVLVVLPTDLPGVSIDTPPQLVGLSASQTGPVRCKDVHLLQGWRLAGPAQDIMKQGQGAKTGGLQTSALAIGHSAAAINYLRSEQLARTNLSDATSALVRELEELQTDLLSMAAGIAVCTNDELRSRANSLALRSSQAALAAAKGAGYVAGHPAGRWCREALFFLVWSCPQNVVAANLCELAGLSD